VDDAAMAWSTDRSGQGALGVVHGGEVGAFIAGGTGGAGKTSSAMRYSLLLPTREIVNGVRAAFFWPGSRWVCTGRMELRPVFGDIDDRFGCGRVMAVPAFGPTARVGLSRSWLPGLSGCSKGRTRGQAA
jgi:hypothetical protein